MSTTQVKKQTWNKDYLNAASFAILYPLVSFLTIGFRPEQIVVVFIIVTIYLGSPSKRKLTTAFSLFLLLGLFTYFLIRHIEAFAN